MSRFTTNLPQIILLLTFASTTDADIVLHRTSGFYDPETKIEQRTFSGKIYIGKDRVHHEGTNGSNMIFRRDKGEIQVNDNNKKLSQIIHIPATFDDYIAPKAKELVSPELIYRKEKATIVRTGKVERIKEWDAERIELIVYDDDNNKIEESIYWIAPELEQKCKILKEMDHHFTHANDYAKSQWIDKFLDIEGFPVRSEQKVFHKRGSYLRITQLDSITEEDLPQEKYERPNGFTRAPFYSVVVSTGPGE